MIRHLALCALFLALFLALFPSASPAADDTEALTGMEFMRLKGGSFGQNAARAESSLPKGGIAGAGIIRFYEFLRIAAQHSKSLSENHYQRAVKGVQMTGNNEGEASKEPFVIDDGAIVAVPNG